MGRRQPPLNATNEVQRLPGRPRRFQTTRDAGADAHRAPAAPVAGEPAAPGLPAPSQPASFPGFPRRRLRRRVLAAGGALVAATIIAFLAVTRPWTASPVRTAPTLLGAPDFNGYCRATGQGSVRLALNNAYGWGCSAANSTGDEADAVCAWTYHTSQVTNRILNFYDPYSWQCWRVSHELGPLNFPAYCQAAGYPGAYYVDGRDAYGWFCHNDKNAIDTQDACLRLYGSSPPVSRFQNFYDRNSWECWG